MSHKPLKIIYGVNAVGGGHTSRARVLGPALQAAGAEVDFLFSGRAHADMYHMEAFSDFSTRHGLRFHFNKAGGVDNLRTALNLKPLQFIKDIKNLDLSGYDLALTDFEPIVPRAAKRQGLFRIGVAHQYAFLHDVPRSKDHTKIVDFGIKHYAPVDTALGLHWHHFNQPILPPIFTPPDYGAEQDPKKILVYLNFEQLDPTVKLLQTFPDHDFYVYHKDVKTPTNQKNIKLKKPSASFKHDMATCTGLITNSGFMSPTEALHLGLKILVKPQNNQPEQASNAAALKRLGHGDVMKTLDKDIIATWLEKPAGTRIIYPNTAQKIAEWVMQKDWANPEPLINELWEKTQGLKPL